MLEFVYDPDYVTTPDHRPAAASVPHGSVWKNSTTGHILVAGATAWFNTEHLDPVALLTAVGLLDLSGGGGGGSISIGDAIGSSTPGSMLFVDDSGNLGQDNTNLFWNHTDKSLIIGDTNVNFLNIQGWGAYLYNAISTSMNGVFLASMTGSEVLFARSRGTVNSPTVVQVDDTLGDFTVLGYDGTSLSTVAASIYFNVDDTPDSGVVPTRITFSTQNGSGSLIESLLITSQGTTDITTPQVGTSIAMVGPLEIQSLTPGSIPFISTGGVVTEDNDNFYRDLDPSYRGIRIGQQPTPSVFNSHVTGLKVTPTTGTTGHGLVYLIGDDGNSGYVNGLSTRGTVASPSASQVGDAGLILDASLNDDGTLGSSSAGTIKVGVLDQASSSGITPGRIEMWTQANDSNIYERFRITSKGTTDITSPDAASTIVTAGQVELQGAVVLMANLPTSDPVKAGQLWNDTGTVKVSAGT